MASTEDTVHTPDTPQAEILAPAQPSEIIDNLSEISRPHEEQQQPNEDVQSTNDANVSPDEQEPEPEPGPSTVFIGGIPMHVASESFRAFMESFGPVAAFKLVVREGSRFAFAFTQFVDRSTADRVKRNPFLHFQGRKLNVGDARRKPTPPQDQAKEATPTPSPAPVPHTGDSVTSKEPAPEGSNQKDVQQAVSTCMSDANTPDTKSFREPCVTETAQPKLQKAAPLQRSLDVVEEFEAAVRSHMNFLSNGRCELDTCPLAVETLPAVSMGVSPSDEDAASSPVPEGAEKAAQGSAGIYKDRGRVKRRATADIGGECLAPCASVQVNALSGASGAEPLAAVRRQSCRNKPKKRRTSAQGTHVADPGISTSSPLCRLESTNCDTNLAPTTAPAWPLHPPRPASAALDPLAQELATSWYHTGYWTGYYAAKAAKAHAGV